MKKRIITIALIAITSFTSQLFAQEAILKTRTKSNQTNEKTAGNVTGDDWQQSNAKAAQGQHIKKATLLVCRVTPTDDGCVVTLENNITSPRDAASGLPTGKRMHQPLSVFVSASDNTVSEVKSPRDAASGLPTGKRMHKPMTLSKEMDKSSPKLLETVAKGKSSSSSPSSEIAIDEPGVHKVAMQDMHFTIRCGGKTTQIDCVDGRCEIPVGECPDGTCSAIVSWSWGASNSGSMSPGSGMTGLSRCAVDFFLEIEDGACTAMAINEKGLPGDKKPNTSTTNNPK